MTLDAAARGVGMVPAFQPIVSLADETVVGFEALARWPDSAGLRPDAVFAHAREHGDVDELDQACIAISIDRALRSALPDGALLSVNCEPASAHRPRELDEGRLQLMFEITERSMLGQPHLLLQKVAALRADGHLVALDDIGAHPDSSALLDVISPDVMKLDLALVQSQPDFRQAQTLSAVLAHHERTGSVILAEGIETDAHLEQALAVGAQLGQGYRFGRPAPLPDDLTAGSWAAGYGSGRPTRSAAGSPFALVDGHRRVRTARKETVLALSRHIEAQAQRAADPPIMLAALQRSEHLSAATRRRYRNLAERSPLVAVFGEHMVAELDRGVRGVALRSDDPMCLEWTVVALGPHTAAALIAREHPGNTAQTADADRRFDFLVTYDRALVSETAHNMLGRIR